MPYIENRIVHDADSHTMELPNWYKDYGSKKVQDAFVDRFNNSKSGLEDKWLDDLVVSHETPAYRELNEKELMIRKKK